MTSWAGKLLLPFLLGITSGYNLRMASRLSNQSFTSGRASISTGPCKASPSTIIIPAGDYADFDSPNYPSNYGVFQKCSWNFQTDTSAQLWLYCDTVAMSWFASLYVIVQGTKYTKSCALCGLPDVFQFMIRSNTATVGLQNDFLFTNKGFSCRIVSVPKTNNTDCNCGVIKSQRIIGGQETTPNQYPWMVLLTSYSENSLLCGGSLITDNFVLTAARCTYYRSAFRLQVVLGLHNMYQTSDDSLRRDVLQVIQHPLYNLNDHDYDVSLLRISAVDFTSHPKIRPICLPTGSNTYTGQKATTAGWGATEVYEESSPVLMAVTVPVISNSACKNVPGYQITDSMICAGSKGLDTCMGDEGGPLFLSEGSGYQVIIGISSKAYMCGYPGFPGVYARMTAVKPWIVSQLNGSTVCPPP